MRNPSSARDAEWLECALADTATLLKDHAHCERKAAATAVSLITKNPDRAELVTSMADLAAEELGHFAEVHRHLVERGLTLGPDLGDPYARQLVGQARKRGVEALVDRLIVCALIEARSCQRLVLLGRNHPDPALAEMFARFARAEANHGNLFVKLAHRYGDAADVEARLVVLRAFEQALIDEGPVRCAMH